MNYKLGIDAGSTTVKCVVLDEKNIIVFSSYERHYADVLGRLLKDLERIHKQYPAADFSVCFTGSAGMGFSERCGIKFTQELIAQAKAVELFGYTTSTLIDIGGEDAKMVFFKAGSQPDIRMNGSCAGGTGAFIDQMASLMNLTPQNLAELALESTAIYPIASRCGVFAKTDVQNLISRRLPLADISASIFRAVALQCASSLAKATDLILPVVCAGGPLSFMPALRKAFADVLNIQESDMILPETSRLFAGLGAAYSVDEGVVCKIPELIRQISVCENMELEGHLPALFKDEADFENWKSNLLVKNIPSREIANGENLRAYLGVDSGSTTTKIAIMDEDSNLVFSRYFPNEGQPLEQVVKGLQDFYKELENKKASVEFLSFATTGYGEDLIRAAFDADFGIVETMAHLQAAKFVSPNVSFVLDIGGQDIKSIFVENGSAACVELNESCSSGCGSFLQGFAKMMDMSLEEFSKAACLAKNPCDLGTRCTVFMNSKVKEALRGQSSSGDIAAGLAVSVIKNCLFKVLKISNMEKLGRDIVVQGGTFKNPAVRRSLEMISSRRVLSTDKPELMGAYGAALYAKAAATEKKSSFKMFSDFSSVKTKNLNCKGCVNNCTLVRFEFENKNISYAGNKCEKYFHSSVKTFERGIDGVELKYIKLFELSQNKNNSSAKKIGIPRVLNMYENFPFWRALFEACGFEVILSGESTSKLLAGGISWLMSDNICFPAKLVHGHILDLIDKKPDRIFYPMVVKEEPESGGRINSFNCPVVSGYPNVIENTMSVSARYGVEFDTPVISFASEKTLKDSAWKYFSGLGVSKSVFASAFSDALRVRAEFKKSLQKQENEILQHALKNKKLAIVITGRPYHTDPLINQKAAQIAADLGVDVISDDVFFKDDSAHLEKINYISQWTYPNRVMSSARAVAALPKNVALVQLNSFGCGPDSFISDEAAEILKASGKYLTVLRVDEISSPGSIRLRLRSLVESLRAEAGQSEKKSGAYKGYSLSYDDVDRSKTLILPWFSDMISPLVPSLAKACGYKAINLPKPSKDSVLEGLKYGHNEVCYPATVVLGDYIKFLKEVENPSDYVIGITQTGGQCRATNYLALIKNALAAANLNDVKLVAITFGEAFKSAQPGFKVGRFAGAKAAVLLVMFTDAIAELNSAMRVREAVKGESDRLANEFLEKAKEPFENRNTGAMLKILKEAVDAFNAMKVKVEKVKSVGFIGEIYLKYNSFSHCNLTDWLNENGIEYVRPPLRNFLAQAFVNAKVNAQNHIASSSFSERLILKAAEKYFAILAKRFDKIMSGFRYFRKYSDIHEMAEDASKIVKLVNQFGEGWLIAGEIGEFKKMGVNRVVCVQPFGCIANHIVAKGIERKVKEMYPEMGILFLDIDSSVAPVNLQNRLHFLIDDTL